MGVDPPMYVPAIEICCPTEYPLPPSINWIDVPIGIPVPAL